MSVPPVDPPVTVDELAAWMKIPTPVVAPESDWLQDALDAALEHVEDNAGSVATGAREYLVYPAGALLVLPDARLQAVTSVVDPDSNVVTPTATNLLAGIVTLPYSPPDGRRWTVTATSEDTRQSLVEAVKIIASHLYGVHRGQAGMPGGRAYSTASEDTVQTAAGFAIPRRAAQLMSARTGLI